VTEDLIRVAEPSRNVVGHPRHVADVPERIILDIRTLGTTGKKFTHVGDVPEHTPLRLIHDTTSEVCRDLFQRVAHVLRDDPIQAVRETFRLLYRLCDRKFTDHFVE